MCSIALCLLTPAGFEFCKTLHELTQGLLSRGLLFKLYLKALYSIRQETIQCNCRIVLYLCINIALLTVLANQKSFQYERPKENSRKRHFVFSVHAFLMVRFIFLYSEWKFLQVCFEFKGQLGTDVFLYGPKCLNFMSLNLFTCWHFIVQDIF